MPWSFSGRKGARVESIVLVCCDCCCLCYLPYFCEYYCGQDCFGVGVSSTRGYYYFSAELFVRGCADGGLWLCGGAKSDLARFCVQLVGGDCYLSWWASADCAFPAAR